ncbi:hypothetical protein BGZ65_002677, partial [Modicella reniformis]
MKAKMLKLKLNMQEVTSKLISVTLSIVNVTETELNASDVGTGRRDAAASVTLGHIKSRWD